MRLLLISDTHGLVHPRILKLAEEVEQVVHAGDIGDVELIEALGRRASRVDAVHGNNDGEPLDSLPPYLRIDLPGGRLAVEHGHRANPAARRHEILRARYPNARLVIYGHSHRLTIDKSSRPWVVNPGAAGRSRTFGGSSCVILTVDANGWRLRPYRFSFEDWSD